MLDRKLLEERLRALPVPLLGHSYRAGELASRLASRHGADVPQAELAGLVHDLARPLPPQELLSQARALSLPLDGLQKKVPLLLHGPVAAAMLRQWGLEDEEVLAAVACHTTGRASMSLLDQVLFLADKLEPGREEWHPAVKELRSLAEEDLNGALLALLEAQVSYLQGRGVPLHPSTLEAKDSLLRRAHSLRGNF